MQNEIEAYLESFGHERYWQEILPAKLRREMAISRLEEAVLESSAGGPDGPYAEVTRLGWVDYQQRVLDGVNIELTTAVPAAVSVDGAVAYRAVVLQDERDELSEEYRRFLKRREERRRSTPTPPRPDSK